MLPNEVFALACRAYYEEQGLIVDETNGQFAHSPYPKGMGETGYYLLWEHHQQQGLLQSRDIGRCCFFSGDAKKWLMTCGYWPDNYFELWDIYENYISALGKANGSTAGRKGASTLMKNNLGLFDPKNAAKVREGRARGCQKAATVRSQVIEVTDISTKEKMIFSSVGEAGRQLGVDHGSLSKCARGERLTCQGFTARYL